MRCHSSVFGDPLQSKPKACLCAPLAAAFTCAAQQQGRAADRITQRNGSGTLQECQGRCAALAGRQCVAMDWAAHGGGWHGCRLYGAVHAVNAQGEQNWRYCVRLGC